jgi:hypothetical protein
VENAPEVLRECQDGAGLQWLMPILGLTICVAVQANSDVSHAVADKPCAGALNLRKILQAGGLPQPTVLSGICFGKAHSTFGERGKEVFSVVAPPSIFVPKPDPGEISLARTL